MTGRGHGSNGARRDVSHEQLGVRRSEEKRAEVVRHVEHVPPRLRRASEHDATLAPAASTTSGAARAHPIDRIPGTVAGLTLPPGRKVARAGVAPLAQTGQDP
jgi:hypothetical protein